METTFTSAKMQTVVSIVMLLTVCTEGRHVSHFYNASRDYLAVTSENYPETYPSGNTYTWEWSSPGGHWGISFLDFDLACGEKQDVLSIGNTLGDRKYFYRCETMPPEFYFQNSFRMQLQTNPRQRESNSRGFKCQVFHGQNKVDVETKIMNAKIHRDQDPPKPDTGLSWIVVALILIIVVLIIAFSVVACVVIRRRRQHQQTTTNTSVHVNIDGIRRESSVSYTRNGGGRTRLASEDSLPPESTTPTTKSRRPVKRSESNASWAMRAEMATSARTGSCSSEGHHGNTTVLNFYSPFPADANGSTTQPSLGDKDKGNADEKGLEVSETGRLSSISEESSASKLRGSLVVPAYMEETSLAIANAGYMVMTGCSGNYINYGGE